MYALIKLYLQCHKDYLLSDFYYYYHSQDSVHSDCSYLQH